MKQMRFWKLAELPVLLLACIVALPQARAADTGATTTPPDKAYLQTIWSGWETLDASHQTQFYAQGPHVFFDEAPLKYDSWSQFESGVAKILTSIKSATFTVNNDAQIHQAGNAVWATATIAQKALLKDGSKDNATLRWTVVFEKQNGRWLIVHEHVSRPAP
jgi:ketosteroid isomerase-like protein